MPLAPPPARDPGLISADVGGHGAVHRNLLVVPARRGVTVAAMPIVPDDADWTWVLERPCPECGFRAEEVDPLDMGEAIRANAAQWPPLLAAADAVERPTDSQWSALEYACHVRDVFRLYDERLRLMLETDDPLYPNWDQDVTAVEERYGEQDPSVVAAELVVAADACAARFESVTAEELGRTGARSDGARFTVDSFARYLLHDPIHHLHDVARGNAVLRG